MSNVDAFSILKFQSSWPLTVACWVDNARMILSINSNAHDEDNTNPKLIYVQSDLYWIFKLSISLVQRGLESTTHFETLEEGRMGIRVICRGPERWTKSWVWSFFEKTAYEELTSSSCCGASSFHLSNFEKLLRSKKRYVHAPHPTSHINLCKASLAHPS